MVDLLKEFIKKTTLFTQFNSIRQKKEFKRWEKNGKPVPPPHFAKQQTLKSYARKYDLKILVETGTHYGDMVEAMKGCFDQIYSIELSKELYEKARKRFKGVENVRIIHGDSGVELGKLTGVIEEPVLFWLDGHYSGGVTARSDKDTPIYEELAHIFNANRNKDVIIIDDARCFGEDPAYPSINNLSDFIKANRSDVTIEVKDDSIRITQAN